MSGDDPRLIGDLHAWVATAPVPVLTVTGHTALITEVRFVWSGMSCAWCRTTVSLWSDDGTIEAGVRLARPRRRSQAQAARWYHTYKPATAPSIPDDCPSAACHRPASRTLVGHEVPTGWLHGAWRLSIGPFTVGSRVDERCPLPAHPKTQRLLDVVWATLRRTHPDLAAAADVYAADQHSRAGCG